MTTGFYVTARISIGLLTLLGAFTYPQFRAFHVWNAVVSIVPTSLWIGGLFVPYPLNLMVQWLSFLWGRVIHYNLMIDWFPYYMLFLLSSLYGRVMNKPKYVKAPFMDLMEYYPAVDMEMRVERTGNFITMVFGYIVVNLIYQSSAVVGFNAYIPSFVLTTDS
jgi:hypothetical protein